MQDWRDLSPRDLLAKVEAIDKEIGETTAAPWVNITGSPFESLWPTKHVFYNGGDYMTLAYGEGRQTPWGSLPQIILLIRQDIANKLLRESENIDWNDTKKPLVVTGNKENKDWYKQPLMGPDWKPAPGFERP